MLTWTFIGNSYVSPVPDIVTYFLFMYNAQCSFFFVAKRRFDDCKNKRDDLELKCLFYIRLPNIYIYFLIFYIYISPII